MEILYNPLVVGFIDKDMIWISCTDNDMALILIQWYINTRGFIDRGMDKDHNSLALCHGLLMIMTHHLSWIMDDYDPQVISDNTW